MSTRFSGQSSHRVRCARPADLQDATVRFSPLKSMWFSGMAMAALVGGALTISWAALAVFVTSTGFVLLFGHSLGSHRKLIHNSFECPKWLEYLLVYSGVQVGLAGPLGLLRQHELRDYAQRLPTCHDYLRHGSRFWRDAWWQLHCELRFREAPEIHIEPRIANDRFYRFLERTWMLQQLPPALLLFALGGWAFVFWGVCARVTAGVFGHWLIGYFAHNHGRMHHVVDGAAVQGRNIPLTSLLTMGECWHNNHHAFPGSARLGLYAGEWDPGWWTLLLLHRLGWVWAIRLPRHLAPRPELRSIDALAQAPLALSPPAPRSLGELRSLVATARLSSVKPCLEGPAAVLPPGVLRWLIGSGSTFRHAPAARRLTMWVAGAPVQGLPALCVALALRSGPVRWLAGALLPTAWGVERWRVGLRVT